MTAHNKNEELVLAYFEAHATDEQRQAAEVVGKTPAGAMAYAAEQAKNLPRVGNCIAVDDVTVFEWTMRYFTDASIPALTSIATSRVSKPTASKRKRTLCKDIEECQLSLFGEELP